MLKYHKQKRRRYKAACEGGRRMIAMCAEWGWVQDCRELNSRRRMRIKARRWGIRHECYECQQGRLTPDLVEYIEKKLGIHLEAKRGYNPVDELFPDNCHHCRYIMRGGLH